MVQPQGQTPAKSSIGKPSENKLPFISQGVHDKRCWVKVAHGGAVIWLQKKFDATRVWGANRFAFWFWPRLGSGLGGVGRWPRRSREVPTPQDSDHRLCANFLRRPKSRSRAKPVPMDWPGRHLRLTPSVLPPPPRNTPNVPSSSTHTYPQPPHTRSHDSVTDPDPTGD